MPNWQNVAVGDEVRLALKVGLVVALLESERSLILRGGIPLGNTAPSYDFTWAFTLRDDPDETTRLLVRERYAYKRRWARFLIEPVEAVSFVMRQKMLRGIRDRAERAADPHSSAVGPLVNYCGARPLQAQVGYLASLHLPFGRGGCSSQETPSDGRVQSSLSRQDRRR